MTEEKIDGIYTLSKPVIMTFPQLFEAKPFKKGGKETGEAKFSANFVFEADNPDFIEMKKRCSQMIQHKWPGKPIFLTTQEGVKLQQIGLPFISGDKYATQRAEKGKDDAEWMRGKWIVPSRSKNRPRLSIIEGGRVIELDNEAAIATHKPKFYSGVEVLAQFNLAAYDAVGDNGKPGVTAYLNMVCSTNKGKRLAGGQPASEVFKGYVGTLSAEDPTAPGAGESLDDLMGM